MRGAAQRGSLSHSVFVVFFCVCVCVSDQSSLLFLRVTCRLSPLSLPSASGEPLSRKKRCSSCGRGSVLRQRRGFCSVTRESVNRIAFVILKRYCVPGRGLASVAQEAEPSGLRQEARRRETLQAASPKDKSDETRPLVACHFAQEAYFPLLTSSVPSHRLSWRVSG